MADLSQAELKQKLDHATALLADVSGADKDDLRETVRELERLVEIAADREDPAGSLRLGRRH